MADKEYIEREAAKQVLELHMTGLVNITNVSENTKDIYLLAKDHAKEYLSVIPAADVVEVRRGEWIVKKRHTDSENAYIDGVYYAGAFCSECDYCIHESLGSYGYPTLKTTNFCPNCGADMRGKNDNTKR